MRLGALFLIPAALAAQTPVGLPWSSARALPWTSSPASPLPAPPPGTREGPRSLRVHLSQDGALRINDGKGILRLRLGLPGRPLKRWRDGGVPVPPGSDPLTFPVATPLRRGIGHLPVESPDFRPALEGLLWILDDDDRFITLVHPATSQVVFLPLPGGPSPDLVFHPDRLEVRSALPEEPCWSVPWIALLPQFIQLGQDAGAKRPLGTVLNPFPRE